MFTCGFERSNFSFDISFYPRFATPRGALHPKKSRKL
jgi:hypothetical protein